MDVVMFCRCVLVSGNVFVMLGLVFVVVSELGVVCMGCVLLCCRLLKKLFGRCLWWILLLLLIIVVVVCSRLLSWWKLFGYV